jgi:hypothetical protein
MDVGMATVERPLVMAMPTKANTNLINVMAGGFIDGTTVGFTMASFLRIRDTGTVYLRGQMEQVRLMSNLYSLKVPCTNILL